MRELSLLFPRTWFLGIGGSIDFIAGEIPRAPRLVQRAGFEWAFRLLTEPRRLARRYLVDGMPFAAHMVGWAVRERVRGGSGAIRPSADQPSIDLRDLIPTQRAHSDSVSPVVEQIDLHGRTVAVLIPGPRPRSISLSFAQYRAAVAAGRLPEPAAPTGSGLGDRSVVDLRDAAAARRDPGPVSGPTSTGERRTW